jgi:hypothetical protein
MAKLVFWPTMISCDVGDADNEKSGASTISVVVALCTKAPLVPVTVNV